MNQRRPFSSTQPSDNERSADISVTSKAKQLSPEGTTPSPPKTTTTKKGASSRIGKLVRFAGLWAWICVTVPCLWVVVLFLLPFTPILRKLGLRDGAMPILDTIQTYWARSLVFVSGIRVEVEGYDHLLPFTSAGKAVLFMPNHASGLDPFILRGYLPMAPRFIFKRSLMLQLPPIFVLGYLLGHIPINRSNRGSAIQSLSSAAEKLKERQSILIFPEGTRSKTGKLLEFKRGPFYLAHDSRAPIVPVYVEGAFELWSAAGWRFHPDPGTIRVRIFPPMTTKEEESVDQLEAKVRAVLLKAENEKKPVPQKSHYLSLLFSIFALAALVNVVQYFFL